MLKKLQDIFPHKSAIKTTDESTKDIQLETGKKSYSTVRSEQDGVIEHLEEDELPQPQTQPHPQEEAKEIEQISIAKPEEHLPHLHPFNNNQEIDVKINKNWIDRVKIAQPQPTHQKTHPIQISDPVLFLLLKAEAKHATSFFANFIQLSQSRFILVQDGYFYVLQQLDKENSFKVKSLHTIRNLFKIIIDKKQIIFCFFNEQLDKKIMPKAKKYMMTQGEEQKNRILTRIRSELNRYVYDFVLIK